MRPKAIVPFVSAALLLGGVLVAPPAGAVPTPAGDVTVSPPAGRTSGGDPVRLTVPGAAWASLAVGGAHTLGLARDGRVYAWGENGAGQLGTGSTTDSAVPLRVAVPLPAGVTVSAVSAGADFSVALASDGTVWTWGANDRGQLGLGSTTGQNAPRQVPGLTGVTQVDAGSAFTVALDGDGDVLTWGANDLGQLGVGDRQTRTSPTVAIESDYAVEAISAGNNHAFARFGFYVAQAWGDNSYGQLGADVGTQSLVPREVWAGGGCCSGLDDVTAVGDSSFAQGPDHELVAFGRNDSGQLGIGTVGRSAPPTRVAFPEGREPFSGRYLSARQITGGTAHTVLAASDGSVWTWGDDQSGQLGTESTSTRSAVPVPVVRDVPGALVAAGGRSSAVVVDGTATAWGANASGRLGDGSTTARGVPTPVRYPLDVTGARIADVPVTGVARATAGTFTATTPALPAGAHDVVVATREATGAAGTALLLPAAYTASATPPPAFTSTALPVAVANAPYAFTPQVRATGPVTFTGDGLPDGLTLDPATGAITGVVPGSWTWDVVLRVTDANGTGTLAATLASFDAPTPPAGTLPNGAVGRGYRAALPLGGSLPGGVWPRAVVSAGALPAGVTLRSENGAAVLTGTPTAAGTSTFTLTTTGPVPRSAQYSLTVGVGPRITSAAPPSGTVGTAYAHTFTTGGSGVTYFVAAGSLPPGLTLNATTGRLAGTPTTTGRFDVVVGARNAYAQEASDVVIRIAGPGLSAPVTPATGSTQGGTTVKVSTPSPRFSQLVSTEKVTLGLTADGYVWAWGDGVVPLSTLRGADVDPTVPVRLALPLEPGVKVARLVAGSATYVVASDGTVRALAVDGTAPAGVRVTTVPLPAGTRVTAAAAGAGHVLALTADGAVWAWGANGQHQLGDGTTTDRAQPVRVAFPAGTVVRSVSAAGVSSLASDSAGRIWAWGSDVLGGCYPWDECEPLLRPVPTQVAAPSGLLATKVVVGETAALAIARDGSVWSWGSNLYRELGRDGWTPDGPVVVPVERAAGVTVTDVALTREVGVALLSDGSVQRWGRTQCKVAWTQEDCGRYDDEGTYLGPTVVAPPSGAAPAAAVAACRRCGMVLTTTGTVWGWGDNGAGRLGDGTRLDRSSPVVARPPFTVDGITFGGTAARLTGSPANGVWTAVTPARAAGGVDVVVTSRRADGSAGPVLRYSRAFTYGSGG